MPGQTPYADERQLSDYLLGRLSPEEESAVEERYFADPGFHDQLLAAERDLIDQYVRGELPDSASFERRFMSSPARRARVDFARTLRQSARPPMNDALARTAAAPISQVRSTPQWWRVAAGVAIVVAGALFVVAQWPRNPAGEPTTGGSPTSAGQPAPPPAEPPTSTPPPPGTRPAAIATFVLMPTATRGSDSTPTLNLDGFSDVRLQLELEASGHPRYRVVVRTADGREVWREESLRAERSAIGQSVATTIPAARLADDDYVVRVQGLTGSDVEELSGYAFAVRRGPK